MVGRRRPVIARWNLRVGDGGMVLFTVSARWASEIFAMLIEFTATSAFIAVYSRSFKVNFYKVYYSVPQMFIHKYIFSTEHASCVLRTVQAIRKSEDWRFA